jgi:hypothetical protein
VSIITLTEAKDLLGVSGTDYDDTIQLMLDATTQLFEKEAYRHIEPNTRTQIKEGDGTRVLWLAEQARSITSIHVDVDQEWDSGSLIDSSEYNFEGLRVNRLGGYVWEPGWQNIQIIYATGFADVQADAPDVWWAAQKTLQKMWSTLKAEQSSDIDVVETEKKNDNSRKFWPATFLDAEVLMILRNIRPWYE